MPEENVVDVVDEVEVEFDPTEVTAMYFAADILSNTWLTWENDQRVEFRNKLNESMTAWNTLRETFDKAAWDAQDKGTLPEDFETIRARRNPDAEKPGRKATPKSTKDILLKRKS